MLAINWGFPIDVSVPSRSRMICGCIPPIWGFIILEEGRGGRADGVCVVAAGGAVDGVCVVAAGGAGGAGGGAMFGDVRVVVGTSYGIR
jgi:hypothetical protein